MNGPERPPLLAQVGARVRAARAERGLTRQALSDASGVSPRYLAQLEGGEGNISLILLERVARALGTRLGHLVGEADRVSDLFARADGATQAAVLRLLSADQDGRGSRIALVGLRGAGKSTLGRLAGKTLDIPFVELNREVEAQAGMPVPEIMNLYGPDGYRALEAQALEQVIAEYPRVLLAVAGGIVADPATYARLLSRFHTVWISASAQEHMDRVRAQGDTRPMAGNPQAMTQLQALLEARLPLYGRAGARLDTAGRSAKTSAEDLVALIGAEGYLDTV